MRLEDIVGIIGIILLIAWCVRDYKVKKHRKQKRKEMKEIKNGFVPTDREGIYKSRAAMEAEEAELLPFETEAEDTESEETELEENETVGDAPGCASSGAPLSMETLKAILGEEKEETEVRLYE